jgi:hypothetical protein
LRGQRSELSLDLTAALFVTISATIVQTGNLIVLAYYDAGSSSWRDGDSLLLHY